MSDILGDDSVKLPCRRLELSYGVLMSIRRTLGALTLLSLVGGLLAAPAAVSPAEAATRTTVSVRVVNAKHKPVKGMAVYAYQGKKEVYVGATNSQGRLTRAAGKKGRLTKGTWTFVLWDENDSRFKARTSYAPAYFRTKLAARKNTNAGTYAVAAGIHLRGTVKTPSGLPVKGVGVRTLFSKSASDVYEEAITSAKGGFHFFGLATDTLYLRVRIGKTFTAARKVTMRTPGATYRISWDDVKVPCTTSFDAVPGDEPGSVVLSASTTAKTYGLSKPGGGVATVLRDGETYGSFGFTDGSFGLTLSGQQAGDHTFSISYDSGDCRSWTSDTKTVTVEAPPAP